MGNCWSREREREGGVARVDGMDIRNTRLSVGNGRLWDRKGERGVTRADRVIDGRW